VHAAGRLTLCTVLALNPTIAIHRVRLDGEGASFVMSRRARAETPAESQPVLLFRRVSGTLLDVVGYVLPDGRKSWSYALQRPDRTPFAGPATSGAALSAGELVSPVSSMGN